jgi:hypothetical protein
MGPVDDTSETPRPFPGLRSQEMQVYFFVRSISRKSADAWQGHQRAQRVLQGCEACVHGLMKLIDNDEAIS